MSFDFRSFCADHHIPYSMEGSHVTSGWIGIRCPFCGDKSDHLGFNLAGGYCYCWKCGGHPLTEVIMALTGVNFFDAKKTIDNYGGGIVTRREKAKGVLKVELPEDPLTISERRYLEGRDFDSYEVEEEYDLRSGGRAGKWKYRIIFPVYDGGKIVSAVGRDVTDQMRDKYWGLTDKESVVGWKKCLYGIDRALHCQSILVCEGATNVWRYGAGAVAVFGAQPSEEQILALLHFETVVIGFDGDVAGRKGGKFLAVVLAGLGVPNVSIAEIPEGKDVATLSKWELRELRKMVQG